MTTSVVRPLLLSRRSRNLLAMLAGILLGLAFPPTGLVGGLLAFVALIPLLVALEDAPGLKRTFNTSFLAMFLLGIVSNYWVGGWKATGDVDPFLMLGGVLLAVVHPFFLVVPWLLYDMLRRRAGERVALYSLPVFYAGFEYWHSFGDLWYPWLSLYNTQTYNLSFIQFISLSGPYLLSMLIVLVNVELFQLWRSWRAKSDVKRIVAHVVALVLLVAIPYVYGAGEMSKHEPSHASLRVTVVQPNVDPWAKWQTDQERILDTNFAASMHAIERVQDSTDLLVWPETAITFYITAPANSYQLGQLYGFLNHIHHPLLTGFPDVEEYLGGRDSIPPDATPQPVQGWYSRHWNAAMLLFRGSDGEFHRERYHKQKLVPLGEHVPFVDVFPFLGRLFQWGVGLGSWNYGSGYAPLTMPLSDLHPKTDTARQRAPIEGGTMPAPVASAATDSLRITPLICYESVYPSFVRHFVKDGANVLAVITNDGWYGTSSGPYQHDQFAVLRAIENRRWVVRSANTGISTIIDDRGRFLESLPLFVSGSVTKRVPLIDRKTPYVEYGDFIAIPALVYSIAVLLYAIVTWFNARRTRRVTAAGAQATFESALP